MKTVLLLALVALLFTGSAGAQSITAPPLGTLANTVDNTLSEGSVVVDQQGSGHCSTASLKLLELQGSLTEDAALQMLYYYPSKAQDILDAAIEEAHPTQSAVTPSAPVVAQPAATASATSDPMVPAPAQPKASDDCSTKGDVEACKVYLQEIGPEKFKGVMDLANQSCYEDGKLDWITRALECRWARAMQRAAEQPTVAAPRQRSMLKAMATSTGTEDSSAVGGFFLALIVGIPLLVLFKLLRRRSR